MKFFFKKEHKCLRRRALSLVSHTNGSSSQSGGALILCLPVIHLSSSPLLDPLFPSLAQLGQNVSLPVSASVSV